MSEHTKGPWEVRKDNHIWRAYNDKKGRRVYQPICNADWPMALDDEERAANAELIAQAPAMYDQLASARAIMQKFVDKVDRGMARSIETYAEMKQWMEEE